MNTRFSREEMIKEEMKKVEEMDAALQRLMELGLIECIDGGYILSSRSISAGTDDSCES